MGRQVGLLVGWASAHRKPRRNNAWWAEAHPTGLALLCFLCAPAFAQDRADIERTQIIGNRELPKVLYIVPWKKPPPGELSGRPVVSVLDEALAPVDRDVFRRQVRYDAQIHTPQSSPSPSELKK
jgi:hypothetical protein